MHIKCHVRFVRAILVAMTAAMIAGCASGSKQAVLDDTYFDLGGFHRRITTSSPETQQWFDRGLTWCYGFNHSEAIRCFDKAIDADPSCAMAHWGVAYACGPHINNTEMEDAASARAYESIQAAYELRAQCRDVERDLIEALRTRYEYPAPEDRSGLNLAYANAMRIVFKSHKKDADVAAICGEALMLIRPWKYWSPDGKPDKTTPEIMQTLERGLRIEPDHPALCHFYVHTMEASPIPERALAAANRLRNRIPDSGHLVHMPSHIDIRLGHYQDAIVANQKAMAADAKYVNERGDQGNYTLYRVHNIHFLVSAAMFDGQYKLAIGTARELTKQVPENMLRERTDMLDAFMPTPLHVLVRFGKWDELLKEPKPAEYLPMTTATWHYARGVAFASTGRVNEALTEQKAFKVAAKKVPETSTLFNNTSKDILGIADAMLAGEIEYRQGNYEQAFALLRVAVERDDALNYDEPWGWMQPARHALGALLLEQNNVDEAEKVYRTDLQRNPNNPWALHGLAECLRLNGKVADASRVKKQFNIAAERSDINIRASCFCRTSSMN